MQKIAILYDASQAVISTFDLDEVLSQILSILRDYFHLQRVAIVLLDPETNILRVRSHTGWTQQTEVADIPLGKGLPGTAAKLKRPIYAPKVEHDPRYIMSIPSTKSELAIPLIVRDEVVGVLDCQSDQEEFFDPETIDLLTLFSTQASIALQNAKLYSAEQRKSAQLEAINTIARQTTAVLDIDELLRKSCQVIRQSFAADHVSMLLLEEGQLVLRAQEGRLTPLMTVGAALPAGAGICGLAVSSGKPVVENDVSHAPGYVVRYEETRSEMCLPLVSLGEAIGVLTLESARANAFSLAEGQPLESVADICATAIQNARYFEKVRQMAYLDGLTGIHNRRYFEMRIAEEIERAQRYQNDLSIIMLDVDNFKKLNDEFGHLLGDETLRQVSTIFSQHLRKVDFACRYGGEEFVILVPQTPADQAQGVAEKLRKVVEGWSFPGVPRPVTVTAGVASYPLNGRTRDELVKAADDAMYRAKQSGRNRVLLAELAPSTK
ncbi:MAG: sensor domain-containing diguanylate cyclase [Terriglobales bacterium]|jgi:diguanylate cyclase (GGDEF)-like protein